MAHRSKQRLTLTHVLAVSALLVAAAAHAQPPTVPSFSKAFTPSTIGPGSSSILTFAITNATPNPVSNLAFTDTLPAGMTIATPASASTDCTGATLTAPDGTATIALSGGVLGTSSTCTVTLLVTATVTGTNTSGDLTSSAGNSGPATATLTVDFGRPGFSKSFVPGTIPLGGISVLTLTIDNSASSVPANPLEFDDLLPANMVIANPANVSNDCGGILTAVSGTSVIQFAGGFVPAGATCAVSVDVTTTTPGVFVNTTELRSNLLPLSGFATAALDVPIQFLNKAFTDDPVPPGGTVTLEFTINNPDRTNPATGISFSDNLESVFTGLAPSGPLPATPCGGGSSLAFAGGTLSLSGGSLPAGGSCTFSVPLLVPGSASPGTYPNTTTAITATIDGAPVTGNTATDNLIVSSAPILTKEFIDDPVGAGDSVTLRFTITSADPSSGLFGIGFTDDLSAALAGLAPSGPLPPTPCGTFSALSFSLGTLTLTDGELGAAGSVGDSCTFDVTLDVPVGASTGAYLNTTSDITARLNQTEETVTGASASDTLLVVDAPNLTKEFTDDPVQPGSTVTLQFTLTHASEAPGNATGIAFTDDLAATLPGLAATGLPLASVCGAGSQITGTNILSFTGGSLAPGASCTFSVTLQVPGGAAAVGSHVNTTGDVTATVGGLLVEGSPATDILQVSDLTFTKEFTDDPAIPGGTVALEFNIVNTSPTLDATGMTFTDDLDATLSGLVATGLPLNDICGAGSQISGSNFLVFSGGNLAAGTSCIFSVTLQVPAAAASGTYPNTTSNLAANVDGTPVVLGPATDLLIVESSLLVISKSFTDDPVPPGGTVTLEFTLANLNLSQSASAIAFTDDLNAALPGLAAIGLPASGVCGAGSNLTFAMGVLSLTSGSLPAAGSCTFTVTLQVPGMASPGTYPNTTSQVTGTIGGLPVTGDPASDDLQVEVVSFSKAFDGPTPAGGTPTLTFTIVNLDSTASVAGIAFLDDLDAVIPGLVATGLPASDVCGAGSLLTGTSILTLTGGNLGPAGSCTFSVALQVPPAAAAGTYLNTTSYLSAGGIQVADPASADLTVTAAVNVLEIPTLSVWGLMLLTGLLALFGLRRLRLGRRGAG